MFRDLLPSCLVCFLLNHVYRVAVVFKYVPNVRREQA